MLNGKEKTITFTIKLTVNAGDWSEEYGIEEDLALSDAIAYYSSPEIPAALVKAARNLAGYDPADVVVTVSSK